MSSKNMLDVFLELRDGSDAAETASADEAGVALDVRKAGNFNVVFDVSAADFADLNETYTLVVDVDSLAAFTDSPVEVGSVSVTATGTYEVPLSADYIESLDANAAAIRVGVVIAGTTPSINYSAYVVPAGHA